VAAVKGREQGTGIRYRQKMRSELASLIGASLPVLNNEVRKQGCADARRIGSIPFLEREEKPNREDESLRLRLRSSLRQQGMVLRTGFFYLEVVSGICYLGEQLRMGNCGFCYLASAGGQRMRPVLVA
jgi:hypothetical protein